MDNSREENLPDHDACAGFMRLLEQRLTDEEPSPTAGDERLEAHPRECAECRALEGLFGVLAKEPRIETGALERRVLASFESRRRRTRRLAFAASAALAAAAAVLFVLVFHHDRPADEPGQGFSQGPVFSIERGAIREVQPGMSDRIAAEHGRALLAGGDHVRLGLDVGTQVTLPNLDVRDSVLVVDQGRAALMISPGSLRGIDVRTGFGTIRIFAPADYGQTAFDAATIVMVEVAGAEVLLDVVSGSVVFDIDNADAGRRRVQLSAGQGMAGGNTETWPLDEGRRLAALELLFLDPAPFSTAGRDSRQRQEPGVSADEAEEAAREADDGDTDRQPAIRGKNGKNGRAGSSGAEMAIRPVQPEERSPSAGDLISSARSRRAAGNWSAAAETYRRVLELHPGSPEATAVLVPLAELELERLRRPDLALGRYGEYLRKMPNGPLGEEALFGRCSALQALGRANDEAAALSEFLRRYPSSVRAAQVKSRLDILGEKIR